MTTPGPSSTSISVDDALAQVKEASQQGQLSEGAVQNIRLWLTEPRYADYVAKVVDYIVGEQWQSLDDAFWTVIPFGTGGRRGKMFPVGSNAINDRTIGESAQGLARYVKSQHEDTSSLACAIAYDTRHRSRDFAELCAGIMVANGFRVYFLDEHRSTPELSFMVRYKKCACGIMVTASHNPPSDNAVKVYWSTGGQILPPHDKAVIDEVMNTDRIEQVAFDTALADGRVVFCRDEVDAAFFGELKTQRLDGPRDLKIIYSPLHGVGSTAVLPALEGDGFEDVQVFGPHQEPDGDFPNVPHNVSNPENPEVFAAIIEEAQKTNADLILATDPDCDRMGCAAPLGEDRSGPWATFTGNQLAALLCDYVLEQRKRSGTLSPEHYVVKTLVTTDMMRRIADSYGVHTYGDLHVGFKWIGGIMDEQGPDKFVFGAEESHGYLVGQYARDKDGAVACMLIAELAAKLKQEGQTLHDKLEALYWQHGYHAENLFSVTMPGSEGMSRMQAVMSDFRERPPKTLAGIEVARVRDYQSQTSLTPDGTKTPLDGPAGNMVIIDLAQTGNYVAVRPSGTEPKVKFYMFTYEPAEQLSLMDLTREELSQRLEGMAADLRAFAQVEDG